MANFKDPTRKVWPKSKGNNLERRWKRYDRVGIKCASDK